MCGDNGAENKGMDRRGLLKGLAATAVGCTLPTMPVHAQSFGLMCSYARGYAPGTGQLSNPSQRALTIVRDVRQAIGFFPQIAVYRGGVQNAAANLMNGVPTIIYNPNFLNNLSQCNNLAGVTVLAHEVGHHANQDTQWAAQFKHPWGKELGADWVSGLAMRRLGVSRQDAGSGILCYTGAFGPGSPTHPDSQRRLVAIDQGWMSG